MEGTHKIVRSRHTGERHCENCGRIYRSGSGRTLEKCDQALGPTATHDVGGEPWRRDQM